MYACLISAGRRALYAVLRLCGCLVCDAMCGYVACLGPVLGGGVRGLSDEVG